MNKLGGIEASKLSEILTIENIKQIYLSLGGSIKTETNEKWICSTICHNRETVNISYKLEFYFNSKRFHCYTKCGETFNIYQLVMKRKRLLGEVCTFPQALEYCCDVCNIPHEKTRRVTQKNVLDDWQRDLGKYLKNKSQFSALQVYDDRILNFFDRKYYLDWLEEGISLDALEMFEIGYYSFKDMITIPVRDINNNLVGIRGRNLRPSELEQGKKYIPIMLLNGEQYNFPTNQVLYGLNIVVESIRKHKKIILAESEKSVMKLYSWYGIESICVATLGSALGKFRRDMILELEVDEVIILTDKDYSNEKEYDKWEKKQLKLAEQFRGFCNVSIIWDNLEEDLLDYKQNAADYDKDVFEELYNSRDLIDWSDIDE